MTDLAPLVERVDAPSSLILPSSDLGLSWRPVTLADVAALTTLVHVCQEADELHYRTSAEEMAESLAVPGLDLERDTLVGLDGEGVPRAWTAAYTFTGDETLVRAVHSGGVDPAWRRRGIGSALVTWTNGRARQLLAASDKAVPGRICVYLDEGEHTAATVFEGAGYTPIRYYTELKRPLDETIGSPATGDGLSIAPWPDDDAVRLAHNEAFADHWGSQPQTPEGWASYRSMFAPQWSFVAIDEVTGEVAGYLQAAKYEHDWELSGYSSGYIHLLGVRRAWRGRGLAKALLAASMLAQRADGIEYAEIGVDTANPSGAHGLYTSLGFEPFRTETMYSIEL